MKIMIHYLETRQKKSINKGFCKNWYLPFTNIWGIWGVIKLNLERTPKAIKTHLLILFRALQPNSIFIGGKQVCPVTLHPIPTCSWNSLGSGYNVDLDLLAATLLVSSPPHVWSSLKFLRSFSGFSPLVMVVTLEADDDHSINQDTTPS